VYLRTNKRKNKGGEVVEYLQLAHNYRHPETKRSIPKVLCSFGRSDQVDRESLKRLCLSTTTSFQIDYADEADGLRKRGHAKDGTWSPQVVVALAVTREGIPVRSWVFPGNTTDVTTVEKVKQDLRGWKLSRSLFVADSGMNSKENRLELAKACGKYLLATRVGSVKEIKEDVLSDRSRYTKISENLQAKEVVVGDGERRRRYILCYNHQATREREHRQCVLQELKEKLSSHTDKKAETQWAIELLASMRFKRYLRVNENKDLEINKESIRKAERQDGKWVIITNDDTLTVKDAAFGYKNLQVIERCFRALKRTQIQMSPMYHWVDRRIETHVKICVLALLLERLAELACKQPWSRIRAELCQLQVTHFKTSTHEFYRRNEPTRKIRTILNALNVLMPSEILEVKEWVDEKQ